MSQIKPKAIVLIVPLLRIIPLLKGIYKTLTLEFFNDEINENYTQELKK